MLSFASLGFILTTKYFKGIIPTFFFISRNHLSLHKFCVLCPQQTVVGSGIDFPYIITSRKWLHNMRMFPHVQAFGYNNVKSFIMASGRIYPLFDFCNIVSQGKNGLWRPPSAEICFERCNDNQHPGYPHPQIASLWQP